MARRGSPAMMVKVWYRGLPYWLNLVHCRRALVDRQIAGEFDSMEGLAQVCNISRSTASRFFTGRMTSLAVTLRILKALHLTFQDVATPATDESDDDEEGAAGAGARLPRRPGHLGGGALAFAGGQSS